METQQAETPTPVVGKRPRVVHKIRWIVIGIVVLIVLAAAGYGAYYYFFVKYHDPAMVDDSGSFKAIANTNTNIKFPDGYTDAQKIQYYQSEASILRNASDYNNALKMLLPALQLANNGPYPTLYADLGDTYKGLKNNSLAAKYYQKSIDSVDASNDFQGNDKNEYKKLIQAELKQVQ